MAAPGYRRIHLYAFRTVIASSFIQLFMIIVMSMSDDTDYSGPFTKYDGLQIAQCCEICLHHTYSIFPSTFLPSLFDLILVLAEIIAWSALVGLNPIWFTLDAWESRNYATFVASMYAQIVGLVILLLFRIYRLVGLGRKGLFIKFGFEPAIGQQERMPWYSFLFGASVVSPRYLKEPFLIRWFRALLAYIIIGGITALGLSALVLGPVQEADIPPVKTFRSPSMLFSNFRGFEPPVWRIFVLLDGSISVSTRDFADSVNVTALWDDNGPTPSCGLESWNGERDDGRMWADAVQIIKFLCPSRYLEHGRLPSFKVGQSYYDPNLTPDLLVTVNFTSLSMSSDSLANAGRKAVSVIVGLTSRDDHVLRNTVPTPLFSGSHLHGSVSRQIRKIFVAPSLASLGIFASSKAFLVANLISLTPDPSPLVSRLPNTATLRIYTQNDLSDWTVVQDYRDKSVLDGFANVGGFWAFTNGLFAFFFGSTLTMIMFGVKPLSFFGVLDSVGKGKLRDHFRKEYPLLEKEAFSDQRGLLTLLREHVVNLGILDHEKPTATPDDTGAPGLPHVAMMERNVLLPASESS